jgi:hypothetical protein
MRTPNASLFAAVVCCLLCGAPHWAAAGSALEPAPAATTAPTSDEIGIQTASWGALVQEWTIRPDGSGEFATSRFEPGFRAYEIVTRQLPPAPGRYAQVEALLRSIQAYRDRESPCDPQLSDGEYGRIRLKQGGIVTEVRFEESCRAEGGLRVLQQVRSADALVGGWAVHAPVVRRQKSSARSY